MTDGKARSFAALVGATWLLWTSAALAQVSVWEKPEDAADDDIPIRSLSLFGFVQPQFVVEGHDTRDNTYKWEPNPGLRIRRARLGAQVSVAHGVDAVFELDLSGDQTRTVDAYVNYAPLPELQVEMGQFRVPFSRQNLVSSRTRQMPDPAFFVTPRFMVERDQGAMLWGEFFEGRVAYYAAVFNGAGAGTPSNIDPYFLIAGRIELAPLGKLPNFESDVRRPGDRSKPLVGVGGGAMNNCVQSDDLSRTYLGVDLAAFWYGASLYAELYDRRDRTLEARAPVTGLSGDSLLGICRRRAKPGDDPNAMGIDVVHAQGYNVQLGAFPPLRFLDQHIELVARHQFIDPNTKVAQPDGFDIDATNPTQGFRSFEFGVSWYIAGLRPDAPRQGAAHNAKIQASYEFRNETKKCMAGQVEPYCTGYINNNVFLVTATGGF